MSAGDRFHWLLELGCDVVLHVKRVPSEFGLGIFSLDRKDRTLWYDSYCHQPDDSYRLSAHNQNEQLGSLA